MKNQILLLEINLCNEKPRRILFTLKALSKIIEDDILYCIVIIFQRKQNWQTIHMKCQVFLFLKNAKNK